jgi:hypothetical protein
MKFRVSMMASTFSAETLEIIGNIDSEENLMIFSYSASVLQGISNSSTMDSTSHITHMLNDKIERLESRGKNLIFWIPGHCGVEVKKWADSEAKKAIEDGRDSQLLLPVADLRSQWTKKVKNFTVFVKTPNGNTGERYFERYCRNGSAPWFREIKTNRRAFVSISRMRASHTSLEASLNRCNIVSTAECECVDGLQTEEHIFWDCKLYEEQRATMRDILSENGKKKKKYPKSVAELLRLEEKIFLRGVCYFINKISIFI